MWVNASVGGFLTLKIDKNGLEVRKLQPLIIRGSFWQKKILNWTTHIAYLQTPQKIVKYYFVAFRVTRWFVELKMAILE
jgi:hypothetical protein